MIPDDLRRAVLGAITRGDGAALDALLAEHTATILANVAVFAKVPPEVRSDPHALPARARALMVLAEVRRERGHPELMNALGPHLARARGAS